MERDGTKPPINDDTKRQNDQQQRTPQYKMTVAYNGYRFNGFQKQPHQALPKSQPPKRPHWESPSGRMKRVPHTVQDVLEHALVEYVHHLQQKQLHENSDQEESIKNKDCDQSLVSMEQLEFEFAGRTDKGVHALGQVITCRFPFIVSSIQDMLQGINSRLPSDVSIAEIDGPLLNNLHPRHDAVKKQYSYTCRYHRASSTCDGKRNTGGGVHTMRHALLDSPCLWLVPWSLHDDIFPTLCRALSGTHDYTSFAHKEVRSKYEHHVMTIQLNFEIVSSQSTPFGGNIVTAKFLARSKGFRRTQVRNLVGFCVRLATGQTAQGTPFVSSEPPLSSAGVSEFPAETSVGDVDNDEGQWNKYVAPYLNLVEAAPASGLCLDYVTYTDESNNVVDEKNDL